MKSRHRALLWHAAFLILVVPSLCAADGRHAGARLLGSMLVYIDLAHHL